MLKHNLFGAFGASAASRAFFALKASDSWKPTARGPDHEPVRNDVAEIEGVLRARWLRELLAEAVIVNGSGVSWAPGRAWRAASRRRAGDSSGRP